MKLFGALLGGLLVAVLGLAMATERTGSSAQDPSAPDGLRKGGSFQQTLPAPPMAGQAREAGRETRNYPEQPPVIPHSIRGYQVDTRVNQCLDCHSRSTAIRAGAPMVSVTHFMDRNQQVLAAVSPGRYFCTQCHVPKTDAAPLVENDFRTVDEVLRDLARERR
ncbi:MAG: nitrate reductase cytochrome c-type subunit [Halomonadaceae bacterium]|nr:MAG: nitrate reductase cytochrome c-type subunit [Halomonadaceae bacterium]